jgi:hypothetical protein
MAGQSVAQLTYAGALASLGVVRDLLTGRAMAQTRPLSVAGVNTSAHLPQGIWKSTITGEQTTLTAVASGLWVQLSNSLTEGLARVGQHPAAVNRQFWRLATASPEAALRRARLSAVMTGARNSLSRSLMRNAAPAVLGDEEQALLFGASFDVRATNSCATNYSGLCENCFFIDQALGRLETGVEVTSIYYQGNATEEPSYAFSRAQFDATHTYIHDPLAAVIVGDSPDNPVRWPWYDRSNLRIVGDPTPNKLRFSDLGALLQDTLDALLGNSTTDSLTDLVGASSGPEILHHFAIASLAQLLPRVHTTATAPADVLAGWFNYLSTWIRTCAYRDELDGSGKRFSIGEAILVMTAVTFGIGLVVGQIIPSQVLAIMGGLGMILGTAILFGTLVVAYNWSYLCMPALPQQLADDIMYFSTYTLFARGPWLLGGIITNTSFTNDEAGICANYASDGGYEYAHCVDEVGFKDFGYVAGFILRTLSPATVEWINSTEILVLRDIVQLDYVQARLNAMIDTYNASDPVSYSIHNSCAYVYVGWSHYAVMQFLLRLFLVLRPLIGLLLTTIMTAFALAQMAIYLIYAFTTYLMTAPMRVARARLNAMRSDASSPDSLHSRDAFRAPAARRFVDFAQRQLSARRYRLF